jgi:hypothetical protein
VAVPNYPVSQSPILPSLPSIFFSPLSFLSFYFIVTMEGGISVTVPPDKQNHQDIMIKKCIAKNWFTLL